MDLRIWGNSLLLKNIFQTFTNNQPHGSGPAAANFQAPSKSKKKMKNTIHRGYRLKPILRHRFPTTTAGYKAFKTAQLEAQRIIDIRERLKKQNSKPAKNKK